MQDDARLIWADHDLEGPAPVMPERPPKPLSLELERSRRQTRALEIIMRYASGDAVEDIRADYDCSKNTVLRHARNAGLAKRPKHFPAEVREAVVRQYKLGWPLAKIAELNGVSMAYISKTAAEDGLEMRKPQKKPNPRRKPDE